MRKSTLMLVVVLFALLPGCASITGTKNQPVTVQTHEKGKQVVGATCTLVNDKGTWFATSPSSLVIAKSYEDLSVTCQKDGHTPGSVVFRSSSNGGVWGNILAGGIIGYAVDSSSGAGFDYPSMLTVEMGAHTLPPKREDENKPAPDKSAKAESDQK